MKVIFLDHDGVICLSGQWGNRAKKRKRFIDEFGMPSNDMDMPVNYRFDDFDKGAIKVLNEILEETGAEIVISSDWRRWATVEEMGDYYTQQGIVKKPIAYTTSVLQKDLPYHDWRTELEETRSYEILEYLNTHPEIVSWVAIDDLNMSERIDDETKKYSWGLKNFVYTPIENEGIKQDGRKEIIIKYLVD
jgi:hypothetical protein